MKEINKKIGATYLGIIFHPELRDKISEETKRNILEMLTTLVNSIMKDEN